jgi:hypothetical protein
MSLGSRLKKAESALAEIGCNDQSYIDAIICLYRGDDGKALAVLPPYRGSQGQENCLIIKALSRVRNEAVEVKI